MQEIRWNWKRFSVRRIMIKDQSYRVRDTAKVGLKPDKPGVPS